VAERGMGRGLSAILGETAVAAAAAVSSAGDLREIELERLDPNPGQPRRSFDQDALQALADSLAGQGVLQPVLARPKGDRYEIVAGERRWRAAQIAGLETIPVLVTERGDLEALEAALVENVAREDLNPVEEARAVAGLVEELGLTREDVGRRIGRGRVAVSNLLRLLDLPDQVLALLEQRRLTEGHGRALLLAGDHDDRRRLGLLAAEHGWSVRETERRARQCAAPPSSAANQKSVHPDQAAAAEAIGDALAPALGTELRVKPVAAGYRVEFTVADADEARELARRLGDR